MRPNFVFEVPEADYRKLIHRSIGRRFDKAVPRAQNVLAYCFLLVVPEWRNWQTRQVQDLVLAREWRFESSFGHHQFSGLAPGTPISRLAG